MSDLPKRDDYRIEDATLLEPMWIPDVETIEKSNIKTLMRRLSIDSFGQLYQWSVDQPHEFWAIVIEMLQIQFAQPPNEMLTNSTSCTGATWLPGARLNIAESCFQAESDSPAIVSGEESGEVTTVSYLALRKEAYRVANGLKRMGLCIGDAVALFMPMNRRSVSIYLGAILAGCVVVSIADSFSSEQVRLRLQIGNAKAIFTCSFVQRGGKAIPLYVRAAGNGLPVVLADDDTPEIVPIALGDMIWDAFLGGEEFDEIARVQASSFINVLFSSGTTGAPKAIPWDHVTPIRAASDGHFHQDIHPGDVVAWPTNFGWMMGPWLTFATLINRGTIALFHGAPTGESFGRFVEKAGVNILGVIPSLVCRWRRSRCMEGLDWSAIRLFSSTGECSNPSDMRYLSQLARGKPIIEYCGGTELGGGYISSTLLQPNIPSTFSTPTLGSNLVILDESDLPSKIGEGYLVHPALGMSQCLLNGDHKATYYQDVPSGPQSEILRRHGDLIETLPNGYFRLLGRADDAINLGGIKVGSAEIERVLMETNELSEVAVIGVPQPSGGPNSLVACLGIGTREIPDIELLRKRLQKEISEKLSPLFKLDDLYICEQLPRTPTNKVMRRELRKLYEKAGYNRGVGTSVQTDGVSIRASIGSGDRQGLEQV